MVEFKILEGNLGLSFSGGTDSSLVMYMLMRNYSGHITVFNTYWHEYINQSEAAKRVYEKCKELTGHRNSTMVNTPINEHHNEHNLFVTPMQYQSEGKIDYVYTGLTANPPVELKYSENKIQKREIRQNKTIDDNNFYMPFINEDKKNIAKLYEEFNLMETLFPLTLSCTDSKTLDHCDACWWCEERKWGFGKL